jgi:predicted amidophosphoribosyltransferase
MPEYVCPHCKKPMYDDEATLCLYCGESLDRAVGFMGKIKYSRSRIISIAVALLAIVSFLLLTLR